jgi:hypothetical protein
LAVVVKLLHCHQVSNDFSHFCLWILYYQNFHNDLKFTTDGQQNQTSHEPRSRAFYHGLHVRQSKGIVEKTEKNWLTYKQVCMFSKLESMIKSDSSKPEAEHETVAVVNKKLTIMPKCYRVLRD